MPEIAETSGAFSTPQGSIVAPLFFKVSFYDEGKKNKTINLAAVNRGMVQKSITGSAAQNRGCSHDATAAWCPERSEVEIKKKNKKVNSTLMP